MNIGFVSTRLAGTDGVSLETAKWATICERLGHTVFYCAGELEPGCPPGLLVPEMHFTHPEVKWIHDHAFGTGRPAPDLRRQIEALASKLQTDLERFVATYRIDVLVVENASAIPMNLPLGVALSRFIEGTGFPTIGHHHDFYWERERFLHNCVADILDTAFPPDLPSIQHVVINSLAQQSLRERRGLESEIVPNVLDFAQAAPGINDFSRNLRRSLGISDDHLLILQPTRVVRRKGIELSIELVRRLREPANRNRLLGKEPVLLISHRTGDEGQGYLRELRRIARQADVPLLYAGYRFAPQATRRNRRKIYALWDAYAHADFVTYPSLYEGFGNALLEAIYFRLPILVNRYAVYAADIGPLGFDMIEVDGEVTDEAVEQVITVLADTTRRRCMVEYNYELARQHFSFEAVIPKIASLLERCGGRIDEETAVADRLCIDPARGNRRRVPRGAEMVEDPYRSRP
ncbi:MAG TPA: glycosyltransferase [Anaerolineae bacterium]|nr:glycosyltransferase [Anaerolineae bacterium]